MVNWHFDATHKHISESDGWAALAHNGGCADTHPVRVGGRWTHLKSRLQIIYF